mgnify:CR=1 FL=1
MLDYRFIKNDQGRLSLLVALPDAFPDHPRVFYDGGAHALTLGPAARGRSGDDGRVQQGRAVGRVRHGEPAAAGRLLGGGGGGTTSGRAR